MLLFQLTGLSGSGKTTLSYNAAHELQKLGYAVEVIDGDRYRQTLCRDLGFSRADRLENINRLGFVGMRLVKHNVVVLLAAINPYEEARQKLRRESSRVRTVWIDCDLETLRARDTKGLYKRAALPAQHPDKLPHFTGVSDPFETPAADLIVKTAEESVAESSAKLLDFILSELEDFRTNAA